MLVRSSGGVAIALASALMATAVGSVQAADDGKYPDWRGAWARYIVRGLGGQPSFDQTKPWGFGQQAPLTPEYIKVLEESLADQAKGGQGNFTGHAACLPAGMPLNMIAFRPLEFVVTPETDLHPDRRLGPLPPHLHGRTRLAAGDRGDLCGLLDRQMDR